VNVAAIKKIAEKFGYDTDRTEAPKAAIHNSGEPSVTAEDVLEVFGANCDTGAIRDAWADIGLNLDTGRVAAHVKELAEWHRKCAEIQSRTRWMREVFSRLTEEERRQCLDEKLPGSISLTRPIDWTKNAGGRLDPAPISASDELRITRAVKLTEGRRGGVFCRKCYRPMRLQIVDGGYDWQCGDCVVLWEFRHKGQVKP
jgi:hypothetical protein